MNEVVSNPTNEDLSIDTVINSLFEAEESKVAEVADVPEVKEEVKEVSEAVEEVAEPDAEFSIPNISYSNSCFFALLRAFTLEWN